MTWYAEARTCPLCHDEMKPMPMTEWHLYELCAIDYICPRCLHVERVQGIIAERKRKDQ